MSVPLIYDDPRPIESIWYSDGKDGGYSTNPTWDTTTSKIVAYKEHGVSDFTPFYAVYDKAGNLKARVPAYLVTVIYSATPAPEAP